MAFWVTDYRAYVDLTSRAALRSGGETVHRRLHILGLLVIPVLVAYAAVANEYSLTDWASRRETALPVGICVLMAALLHPRFRHGLIITLCYGVAFMAIRDIGRVGHMPLPPSINYDFIDHARPAVLYMVAILSATAALAETFRPGEVWARRCYFGAAALYFTGLGIIHLSKYGSWQAIMLCVTGVTAIFGCVFAHTLVDTEEVVEAEEEVLSDEAIQMRVEEAHRRALREKEWHDSSETVSAGNKSSSSL